MPCDMSSYPQHWASFRIDILARSLLRCECTGQCGIHSPNPMPRRCCEVQHTPARWFKGKVRLSLAHICKCSPPCANPEHVLAACQRCHLRIDRFNHAALRIANHKKRNAALLTSVLP